MKKIILVNIYLIILFCSPIVSGQNKKTCYDIYKDIVYEIGWNESEVNRAEFMGFKNYKEYQNFNRCYYPVRNTQDVDSNQYFKSCYIKYYSAELIKLNNSDLIIYTDRIIDSLLLKNSNVIAYQKVNKDTTNIIICRNTAWFELWQIVKSQIKLRIRNADALNKCKTLRNLTIVNQNLYQSFQYLKETNTVLTDSLFKCVIKQDYKKVKNIVDSGNYYFSQNAFGSCLLNLPSSPEIFSYLVSMGYHYQKDASNFTLLHYYCNYPELLEKLVLQYPNDINSKDALGNTPLHYCRNKESAKLLIKNGALTNIKNNYNLSPYDILLKEGNQEILTIFKNQ